MWSANQADYMSRNGKHESSKQVTDTFGKPAMVLLREYRFKPLANKAALLAGILHKKKGKQGLSILSEESRRRLHLTPTACLLDD